MLNGRFFKGVITMIVCIDFDGTLMHSETGTIPESSVEAVRRLKANGHVPVIATGRNLYLLEDYPEQLGIDHVIGSNGAFIYSNGALIYGKPMNESGIMALVKALQAEKIDYTFSTHDRYVTHQMVGSDILGFSEHFNMRPPEIDPDFNDYKQIFQINIFSQDALSESIIKASPFHFLRASFNGYDVIEGALYKEAGIAQLKQLWNLKDDQVMAIGDGMNDVGMIDYAHIGIAMGNAQEPAKAVANYVTDRVENDGLFKALKHYQLI